MLWTSGLKLPQIIGIIFGVIILYKSYIYNDILLSIISILFIVWDSYLVLFENDTKKYFL